MSAQSLRIKQIIAIVITALFIAGFVYSPIGVFTGPILGLWLVATQKPRAGFVWLMSFTFIPQLLDLKGPLWHSTAAQIPVEIFWIFVVSLIGILPLIFHRLVSPRMNGVLSTLSYPLAVTALKPFTILHMFWMNRDSFHNQFGSYVDLFHSFLSLRSDGNRMILMFSSFITSWFAVLVIKIWNHNYGISNRRMQFESSIAIAIIIVGIFLSNPKYFMFFSVDFAFGFYVELSLIFAIFILTLYAIFRPAYRAISWANKQETISLLESPTTQTPLHFYREGGQENLLSSSGEKFPILNGIPQFVSAESLSGANKKYNHLYQTIGGFYDDTQRVWCLLKGVDQFTYLRSYLGKLELKPGDRILETSVGTGLNWKFLPTDSHSLELHGLDLSAEMLLNCQSNLRRWNLSADLVLGNAETLPYADASFDCVFHVGGINFFSDRAKAINEMIRVAKPGTLILIADETEEHVKTTYENIPYTSRFFKKRKEPVLPPTDLIPPTMQEVTLDTSLMNGHFYVLTFRKPVLPLRQTPSA